MLGTPMIFFTCYFHRCYTVSITMYFMRIQGGFKCLYSELWFENFNNQTKANIISCTNEWNFGTKS